MTGLQLFDDNQVTNEAQKKRRPHRWSRRLRFLCCPIRPPERYPRHHGADAAGAEPRARPRLRQPARWPAAGRRARSAPRPLPLPRAGGGADGVLRWLRAADELREAHAPRARLWAHAPRARLWAHAPRARLSAHEPRALLWARA